MNSTYSRNLPLLLALAVAACGSPSDEAATATATAGGTAAPAAEAGKPTAPISIRYEVTGNPVVGQPVLVNVVVSADSGPVRLSYSIVDGSALAFQTGQVESLEIPEPLSGSRQQIAVVPQREGRVYLNVSAEIDGPDGPMIRSMAIPIRVGKAPDTATPNGEVVEGPDGERVNSLPAEQP